MCTQAEWNNKRFSSISIYNDTYSYTAMIVAHNASKYKATINSGKKTVENRTKERRNTKEKCTHTSSSVGVQYQVFSP